MRKKIVFVASLILLSLLVFNLLLRGGLFSAALKTFVVKKMERGLGASVTIEEVRLNLFPPFFILKGFLLKGNPEEPRPLLKSDQIQISFSPWSLLTEYLIIHKIHFQNPEFYFLWKDQNRANYDFLSKELLKNIPSGQKSPFLIQKIVLSNGSFLGNYQPKGYRFGVSHLEVKVDADPMMTTFQIAGAGRDLFYQLGPGPPDTYSSLEWKISVSPLNVDIKKLAVSGRDNSISVKGLIDIPSRNDSYSVKLTSDFRFNLRGLGSFLDALGGHGQFTGSISGDGKIEGTVKAIRLTAEKGKNVHPIGDLEGHLLYVSNSFLMDRLICNWFGGRLEGMVKAQMDNSSRSIESRYTLRSLPMSKPARLFFPEYDKYLEGKTLDASGTLKSLEGDFHKFQGTGHVHLSGPQNPEMNKKNPFWENGLILLSLAESDYEFNPSTLAFKNASLQFGSTLLNGNGFIKKDGILSSRISLKSKNGGELVSLLGYPQWSGMADFTGTVEGKLNSPVIEGNGTLRDVLFNGHSVGNGTVHLKYADQRFSFSGANIVKGTGKYTGEGSVVFKSLEDFNYQIQAFASRGVPEDIIRIFIDNIPLYTRATGPFLISGDSKILSVKGSLELENGTLYNEDFDRGHVEVEITEKGVFFDKASLVHGNSTITGEGKITFQGAYQEELKTVNLRLQDLTAVSKAAPFLQGSFNGALQGEGSIEAPEFKLTGEFPELTYKNQKLVKGSIEARLQDKEIRTRIEFKQQALSLDGTIVLTHDLPAKIEMQGEEIPLNPFLSKISAFPQNAIKGALSGKMTVEGPLMHPEKINGSAHLTKATVDLSGYEVSNQDDIVFQLQDGKLNIESFHLKGEGTSLNLSGGLDLFKQYRLFLTGEADLSLLKALKKEITFGKGKAYLALNVYDQWTDPKIQGGLTIQEGQIRTSKISQTFTISSLGLFFNERQILLESLDAKFGEGAVHATGKIDINHFEMGHFGLILETSGSRFSIIPGWISTLTGNLIYQGDRTRQDLRGELTVSHGVYNKKFDFRALAAALSRLEENHEPIPVFGNTRLNIRMTGDEDLRINNNLASLPFSLDLTLKGNIDQPVLIGRMEADQGTISFYNKSFTVKSIAIDFIDPEAIKPLIDLKAHTQISGKDRTYRIDLSLTGTLDEINRTLTADDPGLTETDILALILAGRKATEVAADSYSQQQIGGQFVPLVIESPFEGVIEELTGLNSLTIEPVSSGIRSTGGPRVNLEQRMMSDKLVLNYSYTMNPSQDQIIRMEYLINRHVFLQGQRNEEGNVGGNLKFRFEFK